MKEKNEKKTEGVNARNGSFRHFKVMVKILHGEHVEYQHLEIFTTGLQELLELRRIHNQVFGRAEPELLENLRCN